MPTSEMGAMPFQLTIILAQSNAYSSASATLCLSGIVASYLSFLVWVTSWIALQATLVSFFHTAGHIQYGYGGHWKATWQVQAKRNV